MSKKDYSDYTRRRIRRSLNSTWEPFKIGFQKAMRVGWGAGLKKKDIIKEDNMVDPR